MSRTITATSRGTSPRAFSSGDSRVVVLVVVANPSYLLHLAVVAVTNSTCRAGRRQVLLHLVVNAAIVHLIGSTTTRSILYILFLVLVHCFRLRARAVLATRGRPPLLLFSSSSFYVMIVLPVHFLSVFFLSRLAAPERTTKVRRPLDWCCRPGVIGLRTDSSAGCWLAGCCCSCAASSCDQNTATRPEGPAAVKGGEEQRRADRSTVASSLVVS